MKKTPSRIPAVDTQAFTRWQPPEVNEGQIIHAEKTRSKVARDKAHGVDKNLVVYSKVTVSQIEEMSQRIREEIHQQAYQDGLKQGIDKGFQSGLKQGESLVRGQIQALKAVVGSLMDTLQSQDNQLEQVLANLAVSVSQSILRRELSIDSSHVLDVIHEAVAAIGAESKKITVFLSSQDFQLLKEHENIPAEWRLHADPQLSPGGCRVADQHSVVDYSFEDQFQQTVNQLVDSRFALLAQQERVLQGE